MSIRPLRRSGARGPSAPAAGTPSLSGAIPWRPSHTAVVALILAVLVAALFWPNAADGLLRLLLLVLALSYVGRRGFAVMPPVVEERGSPFGREPLLERASAAPLPLRELVRQIEGDAAGTDPAARSVPPRLRRALREEAAQRLAEGHRLDLDDLSHRPRIRGLVAEPTWLLLDPARSGVESGPRLPEEDRAIPLNQLDRILDDLERL